MDLSALGVNTASIQLDDTDTYQRPQWQDSHAWRLVLFFNSLVLCPLLDTASQIRVLHIPVLNWIVLATYFYLVIRLCAHYTALRQLSTLGAALLTNIVLLGLADTIAQTLRNVMVFLSYAEDKGPERVTLLKFIIEKGRSRSVILDEADDDLVELGLELPGAAEGLPQQDAMMMHPELFNFERLILFSVWGACISFFQAPWYAFLNHHYDDGPKIVTIFQRVLVDQLLYSPIMLACFFSYMTVVVEKRPPLDIREKLLAAYFPTLATNLCVWPAAQFINFLVIPPHFQIPFSATLSVFWNAYLSLTNPS